MAPFLPKYHVYFPFTWRRPPISSFLFFSYFLCSLKDPPEPTVSGHIFNATVNRNTWCSFLQPLSLLFIFHVLQATRLDSVTPSPLDFCQAYGDASIFQAWKRLCPSSSLSVCLHRTTVNNTQVHQNRPIANGLLFFCSRFVSIWPIHPKFHGYLISTAEFQKLVLCQVSRYLFICWVLPQKPSQFSFLQIRSNCTLPIFFWFRRICTFFYSVNVAEEHVAPKPGRAERCRLAEIVFSFLVLFSRPTLSRLSCQ